MAEKRWTLSCAHLPINTLHRDGPSAWCWRGRNDAPDSVTLRDSELWENLARAKQELVRAEKRVKALEAFARLALAPDE